MPDDFYGGDEGAAAPAATGEGMAGSERPDESGAGMGETTSVPTSIFPDPPKPGKECTFKVVAVRGDETEIAYSHSKEEEGEGYQGKETPAEETAEGAFNQRFPMTG